LAYELAGEHGSPVLLLMGFGMRGLAWQPQVEAFRAHHRVLSFDHAGVGESGPLPQRFPSMAELAEHAAALADAVGWQRFHLVGVSMGGMMAQHLALAHRERLLSLTLVATHAGGRAVLPPAKGLALFLKLNTTRGPRAAEDFAKLLFPPAFCREHPDEARACFPARGVEPSPVRTRLAHLQAVLRHHTAARLGTLAGVPTLVVRPGQDILIAPRESDRLARLIPGAEILRFDEAGHGVLWQCRDAVNAGLLAFFARSESVAS